MKTKLSLYFDDILSESEVASIDTHLPTCPLCRQRFSEFQELRNRLRSLSRPELSEMALASIRNAVRSKAANVAHPSFVLLDDKRNWWRTWLVPTAVGTLASLAISITLLWMSLAPDFQQGVTEASIAARTNSNTTIMTPSKDIMAVTLTASNYARSRNDVSAESPSLNPQGALVALTKSLFRGEMSDDEVTVVADVFSNGVARISGVIEPSRNSKAVAELQNALESDPAFAPFVPAALDNRSQVVTVVFRMQSVNVTTKINPTNKKVHKP